MKVTLYCPETPGLKLGPGTVHPQHTVDKDGNPNDDPGRAVIVFSAGFAEFEDAEFPEWRKWMTHPGTPRIEVLDGDDLGMVPVGAADPAFVCDRHDPPRAFAGAPQFRGHMLSHARGK